MSIKKPLTIKDLRPGDRFVHIATQKPFIKCDHVVTLSCLTKIQTGVGLYDGALTVFFDDEELMANEITITPKVG